MTRDSRDSELRKVGAGPGPLGLTRLDTRPAPAPRTIVLDLPAAAPAAEPAPTFETVRIVPLGQLRTTLRRRLSSSQRWVTASGERVTAAHRVLAVADALSVPPFSLPGEVAVVRRAGGPAFGTIFSVLNGAVFINAETCGEWGDGREDAVFLQTLADALDAVRDQKLFQAGTRSLGLTSQSGPAS